MQRHQLIVGHAVGRGGGASVLGTDRPRLPAHVDHHDLIAETVHLREGMVGEYAHVRPSCHRLIWENRPAWANRAFAQNSRGQVPKGPISLTLSASAAISIPASRLTPTCLFKRRPRPRRDGCGSLRVPHAVQAFSAVNAFNRLEEAGPDASNTRTKSDVRSHQNRREAIPRGCRGRD